MNIAPTQIIDFMSAHKSWFSRLRKRFTNIKAQWVKWFTILWSCSMGKRLVSQYFELPAGHSKPEWWYCVQLKQRPGLWCWSISIEGWTFPSLTHPNVSHKPKIIHSIGHLGAVQQAINTMLTYYDLIWSWYGQWPLVNSCLFYTHTQPPVSHFPGKC